MVTSIIQAIQYNDSEGRLLTYDVRSRQSSSLGLEKARIRFRFSHHRFCVGRYILTSELEFVLQPCPSISKQSRGKQCEACANVDESKYLHAAHLGGKVPHRVAEYMAQPHWLYVAVFADGDVKVGTAAQSRKTRRLAEQGAVCADFVGVVADGYLVRELEDQVSSSTRVSQGFSSVRKAQAWVNPRPLIELESICASTAERVRASSALIWGQSISEKWRARSNALINPRPGQYRLPFGGIEPDFIYDWEVLSVQGPTALIHTHFASGAGDYVVDLSALIGREIDTDLEDSAEGGGTGPAMLF
ncbi:hypothetical protein ABH924_004322 [Arthrobacter sp. GAS37]|uniref:DUF2797 domain-containing protein n=1 Tax=Arthrobacter sp. GAS37 TaxID=3156261 RepID=UPI003836B054